MTLPEVTRARINAAIDDAITSATIDRHAPDDEKVAFGRGELAGVVELFKDVRTRDVTYRAIRDRLSSALNAAAAKYPSAEVPNLPWLASIEWHDGMAAFALTDRLDHIATVTYAPGPDGALRVQARKLLGEDSL